ncbi:hypothetical protein HY490_02855 [Candidatus Woesearchaeota archaeon]|nr:hypothetical protein [Candidatus Woesearchaeota archaeon]
MTTTLAVMEKFEKTLEEHSSRSNEKELEQIVEKIDRVHRNTPLLMDEKSISKYLKARAAMLNRFIDEYLVAALSQTFPVLDSELFDLKRYIRIETRQDKTFVARDDTAPDTKEKARDVKQLTLPLFAYVPLDGSHTTTLAKIVQRRDYNTKTINVNATLPGTIGAGIRQAQREALQEYHRVLQQAYGNQIIGELLLDDHDAGNPQCGALWIPTANSLTLDVKVKPKPPKIIDPALVLNVKDHTYLIRTWRVDDEEPFEHFLSEYASGGRKKEK